MTDSGEINLAPKISVVIPVYGSGRCLAELLRRADAACQAASCAAPQFVLVDDNGPGDAWSEICSIAAVRDNTLGIQLMRNFGQHNAIMCGFKYCSGDVIITMDDDLQHPPECLPELISGLRLQNADLIYGNYDSKKHAVGRNLGSAVVNWFFRLVFRIPVTLTSFRCLRRELVQAVLRYDLNFTFIDGLLAWNTSRIGSVIVPHAARLDGRSGYTLRKLFVLAMNMFTNFSLLPLQVVSMLGLLAAGGGLCLGLWYLIAAIMNWLVVPGYASIIVAVLVLGGLQLLSLGVIGEYIGRLHLNVNRKPQYVVRCLTDTSIVSHAGRHCSDTRLN